jgi:hypothetical protein
MCLAQVEGHAEAVGCATCCYAIPRPYSGKAQAVIDLVYTSAGMAFTWGTAGVYQYNPQDLGFLAAHFQHHRFRCYRFRLNFCFHLPLSFLRTAFRTCRVKKNGGFPGLNLLYGFPYALSSEKFANGIGYIAM